MVSKTRKRTATYGTVSITNKKIEKSPEDAIKKCLNEVKSTAAFYTGGGRFATVQVRFFTEEEALNHSIMLLR